MRTHSETYAIILFLFSSITNRSSSNHHNSNSAHQHHDHSTSDSDSDNQDTPYSALVVWFDMPNEDVNARTDLARCGGSILDFRLLHLSTRFDIVPLSAIDCSSNIIPHPLSLADYSSIHLQGLSPQDVLLNHDHIPTKFTLDLQLDAWKDNQHWRHKYYIYSVIL